MHGWRRSIELVERDRGEVFISQRQLERVNPAEARLKEAHPLTYRFKDSHGVEVGESIAQAGLRGVTLMQRLSVSSLLVGHGEAMWGYRHHLCGLDDAFVRDALIEERKDDTRAPLEIRNGQVDIYTSVHPKTRTRADNFRWFRTVAPAFPRDRRDSGWIEIPEPFSFSRQLASPSLESL